MNFEQTGFNLMYAKSGGRPKNCFFNKRIEVTEFLLRNLNDIDLIVINDVIIDKNTLIMNNLSISRYLKLKKIDEI